MASGAETDNTPSNDDPVAVTVAVFKLAAEVAVGLRKEGKACVVIILVGPARSLDGSTLPVDIQISSGATNSINR